ncbi:MAG: cyclase family protein [Sphingomonas sp.]|jgi:kynurenine formamidase
MPRLIELNHVIEDGMITYKGLPAPVICDFLSRSGSRANYAARTECHIGMITLCSNTGTYLDTAFHCYADGDDLAAMPLERVAAFPGCALPSPGWRSTWIIFRQPRFAGARPCWGRASRSSSI